MTDWVFSVIDRLGPIGVGLLIAVENLIPPIPSEVILPLAGFRARSGSMNVVGVWVAATAGALAGAWVLYGLGAWLGYDRLHRLAGRRWFILASQNDIDRGRQLFDRHGSWIVAGSRCVPVLRSLISIPAGLAGMPLARFSVLTAVGSGIWNAIFIAAGWALADNWTRVQAYTGPASTIIAIGLVIGLLVLAGRKVRARRGT
jgi:membrane protein DedA with SNARE-associated domain